MNLRLSKLVNQFLPGLLIAGCMLAACNNKKKDDKEVTKDTITQAPDTTQKMPRDTMTAPVDTVTKKP